MENVRVHYAQTPPPRPIPPVPPPPHPVNRQYIGARYVPLFDGEWDNTKEYEPLTVVSHNGNSYTSRSFVPTGVDIANERYWALTGNYNAQVEYYRRETQAVSDKVELMSTLVNAVVEGVDNTGVTVATTKINEVIENYPGSKIYFPTGKYLLNAPIEIPSNGVILVCDSDAEFYTNSPIPYLIKIGSGVSPDNLLKMGIEGGCWNGENTTQSVIFASDNEYQCVLTDVYVKDFTEIGVQVGTNNATSTQAFIQNCNILAKHPIRPTATGLKLYGTDNYCNIVNVGHCKVGVSLSGSGNLLSNIHVWWGTQQINECLIDRDYLLGCRAIQCSGNNRIVNLHLDNPYIGIFLTQYNNHLTVQNVVYNFDGTMIDRLLANDWDACLLYHSDYTGSNRSSFDVTGVCIVGMHGKDRTNMKSIRGTIPANIDNHYLNRFEYIGQPQLVDQFPLVDELNNVARYPIDYPLTTDWQTNMTAGWYHIGYIENKTSFTKMRLTNIRDGGCLDFSVQVVKDESITVTPGRLKRIPDHLSIMFGDTLETIGDKKYYPIYLKKWSTGNFYTPLYLTLINSTCASVYFRRHITFGDPMENTPTGTELDLYTINPIKTATFDTEGDTLAPNNSKDYTVDLTHGSLEYVSSIVGVHCGDSNLTISLFGATANDCKVRVHNDQSTSKTVGTITVQYTTELY